MAATPPKTGSKLRTHIDDLRGASRLAIEATQGICDVVEAMHHTIASGPAVLGRPLRGPSRVLNAAVYGGIRCIARFAGSGIDGALAQLSLLLDSSETTPLPSPKKNAIIAILNGVLGDYLLETSNPLAIPMQIRHSGQPLQYESRSLLEQIPNAAPKLLVLVHGSCLSDHQWFRQGHDHGKALSREFGYTPVYLRYNTGLHISSNGRLFASLLEQLTAAWPVPLEEIVILAHSMGGLVSRSACHIAEQERYRWRKKLHAMIFLGTPHHGAPLERGGHWIEQLLEISRYSAPLARLGRIRSAGVTDMRHGTVLDEDWQGRDRFAHGADDRTPLPLPSDVACFTIAASKSRSGTKKLASDGIVPVFSALGRHKNASLCLAFPEARQWTASGARHLDLLSRPEVYAKIRDWIALLIRH